MKGKWIVLQLLALCLLAALWGCSRDPGPETGARAAASRERESGAEAPAPTEPNWELEGAACRRGETLGAALALERARWRAEPGPLLWLDGSFLGQTRSRGGVPCALLRAVTEALDLGLETGEGLTLRRGKHSLLLRPGSAEAELDGESLELPLPVLPMGEDWDLPVEAVAEALGLPRREDMENLVYSRVKDRSTRLWAEGRELSAYALKKNGPLYLRLNELLPGRGAELETRSGELECGLFGKRLRLTGGSRLLTAEGERLELSQPVYAAGGDWYVPTQLLELLGLTELRDPELDQIYYTHIVRNDEIAAGYRVPVLMYHAVSDYLWGIPELFVSPSDLEEQLQALLDRGYTPITFEDLDRVNEIQKPVMLTFDDGYDDNYTELFPLLKQYNVKATVFVIVNDLGKAHKLTRAQVKEMSDSGLVSIQSHTLSHGYLDAMYEKQLRAENGDSMLELTRITGKQPFVLCYPTGRSSAYSRSITAEYYQFGLNMSGPCWVTGESPYRICRVYVPRNMSLERFLQKLEED